MRDSNLGEAQLNKSRFHTPAIPDPSTPATHSEEPLGRSHTRAGSLASKPSGVAMAAAVAASPPTAASPRGPRRSTRVAIAKTVRHMGGKVPVIQRLCAQDQSGQTRLRSRRGCLNCGLDRGVMVALRAPPPS